jgi:hypothetical protein
MTPESWQPNKQTELFLIILVVDLLNYGLLFILFKICKIISQDLTFLIVKYMIIFKKISKMNNQIKF